MYKDALKTQRKFGQPDAVVTAYLGKLANIPPVKMHNNDSNISYSATVSSLVGVFRSLSYNQDLSSASVLGQAVQKLPPNMKEAWSMHTVKRNLDRPTLVDFNDWLKDMPEAHERMKTASSKAKSDKNSQPSVNKTKTTSEVFAATTSTNQHYYISTIPTQFQAEKDHRKRYVQSQAYSDAIWYRWLKEYVPTLNRRSKWSTPSDRELKTGDLVWIVEPTTLRGHYPLARVVKFNYGADAVARSTEVETSSGNRIRPIVKLSPVLSISE